METILVDNNGVKMLKDIPDNFGSRFDAVLTLNKFFIKNESPYTIYTKTDFLPNFVLNILPNINYQFIFITGCTDYSPSINLPKEYNIIINNPYLKLWYTNNLLVNHPKMKAYPAGICSADSFVENYSKMILTMRQTVDIKAKKNKVLCVWRTRDGNICGDEYATRSKTKEFILKYPNIFDWFEPDKSPVEFFELISQYKYVLCPVGNGVDPCPKSFEAIILKSLPIIIRSLNTKDVYDVLPSILIDDLEELLVDGFLEREYEQKEDLINNDSILQKLSCDYWADNIKQS